MKCMNRECCSGELKLGYISCISLGRDMGMICEFVLLGSKVGGVGRSSSSALDGGDCKGGETLKSGEEQELFRSVIMAACLGKLPFSFAFGQRQESPLRMQPAQRGFCSSHFFRRFRPDAHRLTYSYVKFHRREQ